MYVYWHPSTNIVEKATWDLGVPPQGGTSTQTLAPGSDLAQHKIIQCAGDLVDLSANVKTWISPGSGNLYFEVYYCADPSATPQVWSSIHASTADSDALIVPEGGTKQYTLTKFASNPYPVSTNGWLKIALLPDSASSAQDVHIILRWAAPLGGT
jgi:hypothetical protein